MWHDMPHSFFLDILCHCWCQYRRYNLCIKLIFCCGIPCHFEKQMKGKKNEKSGK